MKLAVRREPFDRRHLRPVRLDGEHRARLHRLPAEKHGARAARRGVAADVRARQPELLPEEVHEQLPGFDLRLAEGPVDGHGNVLQPALLRRCGEHNASWPPKIRRAYAPNFRREDTTTDIDEYRCL